MPFNDFFLCFRGSSVPSHEGKPRCCDSSGFLNLALVSVIFFLDVIMVAGSAGNGGGISGGLYLALNIYQKSAEKCSF